MFRRLLPLALIAVPLAVACSVDEGAAPGGADSNKGNSNDVLGGSDGTSSGLAATSGNGGGADAGIGSPLCGVSANSCSPDDDGRRGLVDEDDGYCATAVPDGGAARGVAGDASTADYACRVGATGPTCPRPDDKQAIGEPNADLNGIDGASCTTDRECAPGFDCVAGGKTNVCRRYCCSGSCDGVTSQSGGPTYCDVQQVVRSEALTPPLKAPVCMPIKACTLLKAGDCVEGETCAIVNDKGVTGCVATDGLQGAGPGDSCESTHCKNGLTCLGSPGDRTCYTLCKTSGGQECKNTESCMTNSAFPDTSFGVCKTTQ